MKFVADKDAALDPLENSTGAHLDRPLSARSTPRGDAGRRLPYCMLSLTYGRLLEAQSSN